MPGHHAAPTGRHGGSLASPAGDATKAVLPGVSLAAATTAHVAGGPVLVGVLGG